MKLTEISRITNKELRYLVYSPIGWVVLTVFAAQTAFEFVDALEGYFYLISRGSPPRSFALVLFNGGPSSLYREIAREVYLYVPLITMALFSRELHSGSIKLLTSAPLRSSEIVLGKFLAVALYLLAFVAVLGACVAAAAIAVPDFDVLATVPGLVGIYLLVATYAAIGIFVSSLTRYQVVAAIVTLAVLFVLRSSAGWFQATPVLNEITSWASLVGRTQAFQRGLIATDNVVYFLVVIAIFLAFTVLRIANLRSRERAVAIAGKGLGAGAVAVATGWALSLPQLTAYFDLTYNQRMSLAPESAALMERLQGEWEIETYANVVDRLGYVSYPRWRIQDRGRYDQYRQFNHKLTMSYARYYDLRGNPDLRERNEGRSEEEIATEFLRRNRLDPEVVRSGRVFAETADIDVAAERYRTVRILRWEGRQATLRYFDDTQRFPDERNRAAAIRRLLDGPAAIGVVTGHGERSVFRNGGEDYQRVFTRITERFSLINHGFDTEEIRLDAPVPAHIDILVVADPHADYSEEGLQHVFDYIERGGDMLLLVEADSAASVDPILARLGLARGSSLVQDHDSAFPESLIFAAVQDGPLTAYWGDMNLDVPVVLDDAVELAAAPQNMGFERSPMAIADAARRLQDSPDSLTHNTISAAHIVPAYALKRLVDDRTQRVLVFGDADAFSTASAERREPPSAAVRLDALHYLTDGAYPVQRTRRALIDNTLRIDRGGVDLIRWILLGVLPIGVIVSGSIVLFTRQRR